MAQYPAEKSQADKKLNESTVTVTGCVADKNPAGQFLLTNAIKSDATAIAKDTAATPPPTAATGTTGTTTSIPRPMSYELWGGENLQAHLGHKVEITGTMDKAEFDRIGKPEDKKHETGAMATSEKDVKGLKLKVTSVKMISAVCP
ncbi:MAG: hypothetical protein LC804_01995 [Acidobacteria bacterium]|nr:hypothetical protein [Acidobacteriota bacterium]